MTATDQTTAPLPGVPEWWADDEACAAQASSPIAFPDALASLALHPEPCVRAAVAANRRTTPDVLTTLANNSDPAVAAAVRRNPNAPRAARGRGRPLRPVTPSGAPAPRLWGPRTPQGDRTIAAILPPVPTYGWTSWASVALAVLAIADAVTTWLLLRHDVHPASHGESNPLAAAAVRAWGVAPAMWARAGVGVVLALALGEAARRLRLARVGLVLALAVTLGIVGLSTATLVGQASAAQSVAACGPPVPLPVGSAAVAATPLSTRRAEAVAATTRERCLGPVMTAAMASPVG